MTKNNVTWWEKFSPTIMETEVPQKFSQKSAQKPAQKTDDLNRDRAKGPQKPHKNLVEAKRGLTEALTEEILETTII